MISLLTSALSALDEIFGFTHSMVLIPECGSDRLVMIASHGYADDNVGAEVRIGEGLIGAVAEGKRLVRISSLHSDLHYGRTVRKAYESEATAALSDALPLPGLCDAKSQMDRMSEREETDVGAPPAFDAPPPPKAPETARECRRTVCYYRNDDCIFVDGEYLIRNVPAKILLKVLRAFQTEGRTEFANRELRLDPTLGLPAFKDNLESRLILLRKRLEQKCPDIRIVPTKRGRFALSVDCGIDLVERETA